MIYEICAGIATLMFIVLTVYLVKTLIAIRHLAEKVNSHIDPLSLESLKTMKNTSEITDSIKVKLDSIDPLFESIHTITNAVNDTIKPYAEKKKPWQDTIANVLELTAAGILFWQEIKKRRS